MYKKCIPLLFILLANLDFCFGQQRPGGGSNTSNAESVSNSPSGSGRNSEPRPFKEIITSKAISKQGLFTVHKVKDKWYFEIPDSILGREILTVSRYSKTPAGGGNYGGERVNEQTIKWEKGPSQNIFLRVVTVNNNAQDTLQIINQAVRNSNLDPIAAAFDIKAYGKDSTSVVIDVTDFFKGDNQAVSLSPDLKKRYNLGALASDRSYIESIKTFPINTEISSFKTFSSVPAPFSPMPSPNPTVTLPAAEASGSVTLGIHNSFLLLPKNPMRKRLFDPRIGYFASGYEVYSDDQQRVDNSIFIRHWRLEPKPEDLEKWKKGELVEPKKQIVYYIDPATPKKWRPYLIAGINDWQKAFEKAGFKNAIIGKEWPENDPGMSLEDARFSVIRYFASDILNAYGPNEADPRSGEILESHIGWYHNVMKLLHNWYMIQTAAVEPRARKMKFDDTLMGDLIRFVSSHEVGHTLGLRHNMGSSSRTPVEKLRDKAWVEANGHTASIMDYARFNYVAQPEDHIAPEGLYPRIGSYDKWAIEWGYKYIYGTKNADEDKIILNRLALDSLKSNPRLWFGGEGYNGDPRAQTEDLSDNSVKASEYGIKNLKRILPNLPEWTKEEADKYENLKEMYGELIGQFGRYMGHVTKNIGGTYETFKSIEQSGNVYEPTPKPVQKNAVAFLNKQLFETPTWLLNPDILNKISDPASLQALGTLQTGILANVLSAQRLYRMTSNTSRFGDTQVYSVDELMSDLQNKIFREVKTHKSIDINRRNLQKAYVEDLINLLKPQTPSPSPVLRGFPAPYLGDVYNSDIPSIVRGSLVLLRTEISNNTIASQDKLTKYHLQDLAERIKQALNPKS